MHWGYVFLALTRQIMVLHKYIKHAPLEYNQIKTECKTVC